MNRRDFLKLGGLASLSFIFGSCGGNHGITRVGCLPFKTLGTSFSNPENLGTHRAGEVNGQIYCKNGGMIDLAHFRNTADATKSLKENSFEHIINHDKEFSFQFNEPSKYFVKISYPENWNEKSVEARNEIAEKVSINLGQYFSYTGTTWHEVLTWFGHHSVPFISEFASSFSCEDNFSNVLGSYIGRVALEDNENEFNQAVTLAMKNELNKLGIQPKSIAEKASDEIGRERHFDIGLDGYIAPLLAKNVCEGAIPCSYAVPNLDILSKYNFSVNLEIDPVGKRKLLDITGDEERIALWGGFKPIMKYIKKDAEKRGISYVGDN